MHVILVSFRVTGEQNEVTGPTVTTGTVPKLLPSMIRVFKPSVGPACMINVHVVHIEKAQTWTERCQTIKQR